MPTLSSALVKLQVATMADVEEALARQVLYGGDLSTNLLEAAAVSEDKLIGVLAQCMGTKPAPIGELPKPDETTLRLVPADLVTRHGVYPMQLSPRELVLAVSEILPPDVEADLAATLGLSILQRAAPLVRVRQAIARDYGVPLEQRLHRLVAKLEGKLEVPHARKVMDRQAVATLSLPRPATFPPAALPSEIPHRLGIPGPARVPTLVPQADRRGGAPWASGEPSAQDASSTVPEPITPMQGASVLVPSSPTASALLPSSFPQGVNQSVGRERAHTLPSASFTPPPGFEFPRPKKSSLTATLAVTDAVLPLPPATPRISITPAQGSPAVQDPARSGPEESGAGSGEAGAEASEAHSLESTQPELRSSASLATEPLPADPAAPGSPVEETPEAVLGGPVPGTLSQPPSRRGATLITLAKSALPPPPGRPRRGPYALAAAEEDLRVSGTRDEVIATFFHFVAQFFEYAVLFVVSGEGAKGRDSFGLGPNWETVSHLTLALDAPGALRTAKELGCHALVALGSEGEEGKLTQALGRHPERLSLLLPVVVRERCVLLVYGDHGQDDVELSALGDVLAFVPRVASALERVILKKKKSDRGVVEGKLGDSLSPAAPRKSSLPDREKRTRALALAVGAAKTQVPGVPSPEHVVAAAPAPFPLVLEPGMDLMDIPAQEETPVVVPSIRASWTVPVSAGMTDSGEPAFPLTRRVGTQSTGMTGAPVGGASAGSVPVAAMSPGNPSTPATERSLVVPPALATDFTAPPAGAESPPATHLIEAFARREASVADARLPREFLGLPLPSGADVAGEEAPPEFEEASSGLLSEPPEALTDPSSSPPPLAFSDESPELSLAALGLTDAWEEGVVSEDGKAPLAPSTRTVRIGARRLPAPQNAGEIGLPSVIVDVAIDAKMLVDRIAAGDESATDQLKDMGEVGVAALVSRFPGPITNEPRPGTAALRPSRCGPLLHALVRLGRPTVRHLVLRTADADPSVRAWATRLLGEIPSPEGAEAIARRFADPEETVRRAALSGARLLENNQPARGALRMALMRAASDRADSSLARTAALEALAELRDPASIVPLIELLSESGNDIPKCAHWALVVTARQDFGLSPSAWLGWWEKNCSRHRIEWLIDALVHESGDIRRAAGDELKSTTKEYFGYYDDLPKKERQRAQQRYRDWWEAKGRILFS